VTPVDATIRPVERADLLAVVRIERTCFSDPWPYDAFERLLEEPAFLVAEWEGQSSATSSRIPLRTTAATSAT